MSPFTLESQPTTLEQVDGQPCDSGKPQSGTCGGGSGDDEDDEDEDDEDEDDDEDDEDDDDDDDDGFLDGAEETSASGGVGSLTTGANAAGAKGVPTLAALATQVFLTFPLLQKLRKMEEERRMAKKKMKTVMKAAVVAAERAGSPQVADAVKKAVNEAAGVVKKGAAKETSPRRPKVPNFESICWWLLILVAFGIGAALVFCGIFAAKKDWAKSTCTGVGAAALGWVIGGVIASAFKPKRSPKSRSRVPIRRRRPAVALRQLPLAQKNASDDSDLTFTSYLKEMSGWYWVFLAFELSAGAYTLYTAFYVPPEAYVPGISLAPVAALAGLVGFGSSVHSDFKSKRNQKETDRKFAEVQRDVIKNSRENKDIRQHQDNVDEVRETIYKTVIKGALEVVANHMKDVGLKEAQLHAEIEEKDTLIRKLRSEMEEKKQERNATDEELKELKGQLDQLTVFESAGKDADRYKEDACEMAMHLLTAQNELSDKYGESESSIRDRG